MLDPFAGVGGNVIQFAATCGRIVAGELSPDRASLIRHNAAVYEVAERVEVRCSDFWETTRHVKVRTPTAGAQQGCLSQPSKFHTLSPGAV